MTVRFNNYAKLIDTRGPKNLKWYRWRLFVDEPEDILEKIQEVEYVLHPSFPPHMRVQVKDNRAEKFALETSGWGEFNVYIKVTCSDGKTEDQVYWLRLTKDWPKPDVTDMEASANSKLLRLAEEYVEMHKAQSSPARTSRMEDLVWRVRSVASSVPTQPSLVANYLNDSDHEGKRIVGLSILEESRDPASFDQLFPLVLDKVTDSRSAFEQYHALRVLELMVPDLTLEQRRMLKKTLSDQMSGGPKKWILPGTDRHNIASRIMNAKEMSTAGA